MQSSNPSPLQFNTGSKKSSSSSYKRKKKSNTGVVTMLMLAATGIWLMTMLVLYLYMNNQVEGSITRKGDKVISRTTGEQVDAQVFDGVILFGFLCWGVACPSSVYGMVMVALLIVLLVMQSSEKKAATG